MELNVDEIVKEIIETEANKVKKNINNIFRDTIYDIVDMWFGEFNSESVKNTFVPKRGYSVIKNDEAVIYANYCCDPSLFTSIGAEKWREKHGGAQSGEWIVGDLMMKQGIIGLPSYANTWAENNPDSPYTGRGFVKNKNMHYHQRGMGLKAELFSSPLWLEFASKVLDLL